MNLAGGLKEVEALKVISSSLTMICKVFYSLNFQDLPEFFEDNMETWMTHFLTLLSFDVKELHTMVSDFHTLIANYYIQKEILYQFQV